MDDDLDALLAEADEIIAHPDDQVYRPVLLLQLLVAIARELRTPVGGG